MFGYICSCLAVLLLVATIYDVRIHQPKLESAKENTEEPAVCHGKGDEVIHSNLPVLSPNERTPLINDASHKPENCEAVKEAGTVGRLLLCFSLYTNIGKLLSTKQAPGSIRCLHGIRFLSMSWVILGHTHIFVLSHMDNPTTVSDTQGGFLFQAVGKADVSVDSFFVLSGLLMSYILLQKMQKSTEKGKQVPFGMMYLHRYLRLTPTLLFLLMLYTWVYPYLFINGPTFSLYLSWAGLCVTNWWTNVLYINNFVHADEMCMGWTWYLANDMQFFVIGVPLVYIFFRWRRFGCAVLLILLLASFITTAIILLNLDGKRPTLPVDYKPYCRIGPYLVGVAVGCVLLQTKGKVNKTKTMNLLATVFWTVATASALAVVYGLYDTWHGTILTFSVKTLYDTVHRTVWGMAVGWVVMACYHGFGGMTYSFLGFRVVDTILSWGFFVPLSRLTYSAYMVQQIVVFIAYQTRETLVHYTTLTMIYFFLGNLVIAYAAAFLVFLAVEAPLTGLEKLIFRK